MRLIKICFLGLSLLLISDIPASAQVSGNFSAGSVRIGNDATCDGTRNGALRYNGTIIQFCNGTTWGAMGSGAASADIQTFTASGTWTKPSGAKSVHVVCIGGGGSAGYSYYGPGGGEGGGYASATYSAALLGSSETVTRGAGGAGGGFASSGTAGGASTFGSWLKAGGGAGGNVYLTPGTGKNGFPHIDFQTGGPGDINDYSYNEAAVGWGDLTALLEIL